MGERYANALAALSERYVGTLAALRRRYVSALAALRDRVAYRRLPKYSVFPNINT